MSIKETALYKRISVDNNTSQVQLASKAYRGISTVNPERDSAVLYDLALIKQDIINNFYIRQGEKLENPEFGTIIWDVLYDPLTETLKEAIANNVTTIVNYDPRVQVNSITVTGYESGIQIEVDITFIPYNISESMRLTFDEANGI